MPEAIAAQYDKLVASNFPKNKQKVIEKIILYMSRHSDILERQNFSDRPLFADIDRDVIFDAVGIQREHIVQSIKESHEIKSSWQIQTNPFYITTVLAARERLLAKDKDTAVILCFYMSIMMYTSIHSHIFQYGVNKAIMDYTLANLNNRYKLKKLGTLYLALQDTTAVCVETYTKDITQKNVSDKVIGDFAAAMHNRVKGFIKELADEYYTNHENGKFMNLDDDSISEDDYHLATNDSYVIDNLSKRAYLNTINKGINRACLNQATISSDISTKKIESILVDMINEDNNQSTLKLLSSILEYYVFYSGNSVNDIFKSHFIEFMLSAYKSNTDAPQMKFIKSYLDDTLTILMVRYGKQRYGKTMINNYKKSIFMYFVYYLNKEAKGGM